MSERSFGQIVREARLERHLSMGQLAAAVDHSTASVRRWERDDGLPTPDVVEALVDRLDLDPEEVEEALSEVREDPDTTPTDPTVERAVEQGDPIDVVPLSDVADAVDAGSASDWKQPPIDDLPAPVPAVPPVARQTVPTPWPTGSVPVAVIEQDQTFFQVLRDPDKPWLSYIRAALTIVALGALVWVLLWAFPEFLDALGETWDSLWRDEGGTSA